MPSGLLRTSVPLNIPTGKASEVPTAGFTASCDRIGIDVIGGCIVAGEAAQVLCMVDGSQLCRPYTTDGLSVNLIDLSEDDIDHCGPCGESLKCPLDNASCGDGDTMLICHFEGGGEIPNKDICTAASVFPTFVETKGNAGHPLDFCGCCDGFAPSFPEGGKCSSIGYSIGSSDPEPFNACCNPCREEVPEEFRPCCCQQSGKCSNDASQILLGGYENCVSELPSQASTIKNETIPSFSSNTTLNTTSSTQTTQAPVVATNSNSTKTVTPTKSPITPTANSTNVNSTKAPINKPIVKPTKTPTRKPTVAPISYPTEAPTKKPTIAPISNPTKAPTKKPSSAPIFKLTTAPSNKPTYAPISKPTKAPSQKPTNAPTRKPSFAPTSKPTAVPTKKPILETNGPTMKPIVAPTGKPTSVTTDIPTADPTIEPTAEMTTEPTVSTARTLVERNYNTETVSTNIEEKTPSQNMNPMVSLATLISRSLRWLLR